MKKISPFALQVYEYLTTIPKGKVVTYKQVALAIGKPKACRAVGNALHNNPDGKKYPCFKVVNSKGQLAENFGAVGGKETQKKRLINDGVKVEGYQVDLNKYLFKE